MSIRFAKVDGNLDSHPKIRRAGRDGREVFLFVLRRNALLDRDGRVPMSYLEPWYLADQLMMTEAQAISGMSRIVTAELVTIRDGHAEIVGWDDEWAKQPLSEAQRKAKQRGKSKPTGQSDASDHQYPVVTGTCDVESRNVTNDNVTDRDCPDSHTSEESRREEKRVEETRGERESARPHVAPAALADALSGPVYDPDSPGAKRKLAEQIYERISTARIVIAKKLGLPDQLPFPAITPSTRPQGFRDLLDRIAEEGVIAPEVCARVVVALVAQAESGRTVEWLSAKAFSSGGWRTAREFIPGQRSGPRDPRAPRSPHVGRVEPQEPSAYADGDQEL